jgi:hypothetical protein
LFDTIAAGALSAVKRLIRLLKKRVEVKAGIIRDCNAHADSDAQSMLSNGVIGGFKRCPHTFCEPEGIAAPRIW